MIAHAFDARQSDVVQYGDQAGPLDTDGQSVGVMQSIAIRTANTGANGHGVALNVAHTLDQAQGQAVAIGIDEEQNARLDGFGTLKARMNGGGFQGAVMTLTMAVRRLTPRECERLQGFPDDYTLITYRGKPARERLQGFPDDYTPIPYRGKLAADGPRYKALGNSMAVPVMAWIGRRVDAVRRIDLEDETA